MPRAGEQASHRASDPAGGGPTPTAPALTLPKGGGAIRGIGEKFAAEPATGTGTLSVPVFTSPGRQGFGPELSLSYDSGSGNGPFGFGWTLGLPEITRKTDQGLPRYRDTEESDVFILSGSEDLVPVLAPDGRRVQDDASAPGYVIHRYRPRVEQPYARIERWTRQADGSVHWRSFSGENILTIYGRDDASRIADPDDPRRVFSWLICESRDDKGNAILYDYKREDGAGADLTRAHERHRGPRDDPRRAVNRYLKRIRYGNTTPLLDAAGRRPTDLTDAQREDGPWSFEVVLDYGEHDVDAPTPTADGEWAHRSDPFSTYRSGFELRTARLCRRVLMFHHFEDEPDVGRDCVVRSTDFTHLSAQAAQYSFLDAVRHTGWRRGDGGYQRRGLPALQFEYSAPTIDDTIRDVDPASLEQLPIGVDGGSYRWTDLHGDGLPGVLTEQGGAWYFKRNLSPLHERELRLAPAARVEHHPSRASAELMDLAGDGLVDLVVMDGESPGFYEHDGEEGWRPFAPFTSRLLRDLGGPGMRLVDLDGDGRTDVLLGDTDAFTWHASEGEAGFGPAQRVAWALDDDDGPRLAFTGQGGAVQLADLSGDGLADLVRIGRGEVSFWPNLGYGRFGPRVAMDNAPRFDDPDHYDPARLRVADIDGTGTADLVYLHRDGVDLYFNQSGNRWSEPHRIRVFGRVDDVVDIALADILGDGTSCLVWSSPLPADAPRQMRYVRLMGAGKPHLLTRIVNNLGAETRVGYAPSTRFYLQDRRDGQPWETRLPFPVHVVERVETYDHISRNRFVSRYAYHHGYFDGDEREFRGFGLVDRWDTEAIAAPASNVDAASHVPPVLTRTWFHTGAAAPRQEREASRALKGMMLRQEVYALDDELPYTVTEHRFSARLLQARHGNRHAVYDVTPTESVQHDHERDDDEPRVQHTLTLEVDPFGNVLKEATVGYGRRDPDGELPADADRQTQERTLVTYSEHRVTRAIDDPAAYRAPLPCETRTFELTGYTPTGADDRFAATDFVAPDNELAYEEAPTGGRERRLIEHARTRYRADDLSALLALGELESLALPGESVALAFTSGLLDDTFTRDGVPLLDPATLDAAGYLADGGLWWRPEKRTFLSPDPAHSAAQELAHARAHFFLPHRFRDPFENDSFVAYDAYDLLIEQTEDALGNRVTAGSDYRVLAAGRVTDRNGNRSVVAFDALGMVVGTAVMGKPSEAAGDSLDDFEPDLSEAVTLAALADPLDDPASILGNASTRLVYDSFAYQRSGQPPVVYTLTRETHVADLTAGESSAVQHGFAYSDGLGREIQRRVQAEPGPLTPGAAVTDPRWVVSGWTIFDNKGNPVRRYEPFFSATHAFEFGTEAGVSSTAFYDPIGRVVATLRPDNTYEKTVYGSWRQRSWDANDTVLDDPRTDEHIGALTAGYFAARATWETWHEQRAGGALGTHEQTAASQAAEHARTPTTVYLDGLGRPFLTVADNGRDPAAPGPHVRFATRTELDIEGNERAVRDADQQGGDATGRVLARHAFDLLGNRVREQSMDAGTRWMLGDAAGAPALAWDSRGHRLRTEYDALRRPVATWVTVVAGAELLTELRTYGEQHPQAEQLNLRGELHRQLDQAGLLTTDAKDFKGNTLRATRRLTNGTRYRGAVDWNGADEAALLEAHAFASMTAYDALNRPVLLTAPQAPGAPADVIRTTYNEANLLERIDVRLEGTAAWTAFVAAVEYDAHGRRTGIEYGNGTASTYEYDPLTFRLARTVTRRDPAAFDDCPQPPPAGWPGCQLQNLRYTYDPVGNLTRVQDDAQQAIFFRNRRVEPSATYVYDATYRLIEATGREHLGQVGGAPIPHSSTDGARTGLDWAANDGAAMGTYTERYRYDAVGNLLELAHHGTSGWSRMFSYEEASGLDALRSGNRLSTTTVGQSVETYGYDAHGNTTRMPHLGVGENAAWDHRDQLRNVNLGGGGTAYFVYDAAGERVRKVWEKAPGHVEERIYLGVFELFRKTQGGGELHRATLHVMDGEQRVALVETRTRDTAGTDTAPRQLLRFQLAGQLGSGVLELDEASRIIAYEEYTPYGSTAYQAVRSQSETPRRYRFTAKERDGETGLYHHGARYYAPWLGRWTSSDPVGLDGGLNTYLYAAANPTMLVDPGGTAPKKYEKQRPKDTAAKAREMERNLKEAKKQGLKPDPMQKRADALAKKRGKTPIEQHHHKGVKEAAKTKLDPKKMGDTMSSVWSTKSDPVVKAGIGDKPVWDPKFDGDLRTHHNVGKHLDYDEQASRPKTAKGLEDAAAASKQRLPATVDLTERAKLDWTRTVDKGPAINPKTGAVKEALEKTGKSILKKLAPKALKVIPFVGIGAGLYSTQAEAAQGNYVTAGAEAVGMIPVVGDVVDAARLGYAVGEVANEVLGIDEVAAEHGDRFEKAASSLGLGEDGARLVGATGAALSSITVAPTIAMTRKLTALFD